MSTEKENLTSGDLKPPEDFHSLAEIAEELRRLRKEAIHTSRGGYRVASLYRQARGIEAQSNEELFEFLSGQLLVDCLETSLENDSDRRADLGWLRDVLSDWLDKLSDSAIWTIRHRLQAQVIEQIRKVPSPTALYTLAVIGYRNNEFVNCLLDVGRQDGELGDTALRLLLRTDPDTSTRDACRQLLADRIERMVITDEGLHAVAAIGGEWAVTTLFDWIKKTPFSIWDMARFSWVAELAPGDEHLQLMVWDKVRGLITSGHRDWNQLIFGSSIPAACRAPQALREMLDQISDVFRVVSVDRLVSHLERIDSVAQVRGIFRSVTNLPIELMQLATQSTGPSDPGYTVEGHVKKATWELLKLLGSPEMFVWLEAAVDAESNDYRKHNLMDDMAIYAVPQLPQTAKVLLSQQDLTFDSQDSQKQLLIFLAASRLAASQLTFEALGSVSIHL